MAAIKDSGVYDQVGIILSTFFFSKNKVYGGL